MNEEDKKKLAELIVQLAHGDISVLEEISNLIERVLMTIGNYYYKNRADIEDRIYELYLILCEKASRFRNRSNAYAWILRIFENYIKSQLRMRKREQKYLAREISYFKSDINVVDERYVEQHLFLREMLDKLTEEERKIVMYYYWCKCTVREIAEILHKPKSTISYKLKAIEEKIKNL